MNRTEYDYIVVGAGSAGCVLAHRLSEDPNCSVLLLEAGGSDRNWRIEMPSALAHAFANMAFNWGYETEPEPHLNGRRIRHLRGRILGGSSSINGMMYIRGHARDYDQWAQSGCEGWTYADVLPYFRRAEGHDRGGDRYRGADGPLQVTSPEMRNPLFRAFIEAGVEAGYPRTDDVNGYQQEGFGRADRTTSHDGRRMSAARAYLRPIERRANLTIVSGALVRRVVVEKGRATGVAYARSADGESVAHAAREVILTAGAINSPQLLMLSGIGPAEELRRHGLPVLADLPGVGANLHDHPDIPIKRACLLPVSMHSDLGLYGRIKIGLRWFLLHDGPGASNHLEAIGFIRSRAGIEHPDLQLNFLPMAIAAEERRSGVSIGRHGFTVFIDFLRPTSRGRLCLRSADPRAHPSLLFNYLQTQHDIDALIAAVRLTREILAQPALAQFCGEELLPTADIRSDAEITAWLREHVGTSYHPVGSCKMGRDTDRMAVVDASCRVFGIERLRVVDGSIMPTAISGNTNAPIIMIAEKAADLIRDLDPLPRSDVPVWTNPDWESRQR
jgi:choline dehydrogenase